MKILFLTNNCEVSKPLWDWLSANGEDVHCYKDPIDSAFVIREKIDFIISYNYIHLIKRNVLDILPHRVINLHISLLPYNRGASPNIWSFINGTLNGITIHEIDEGLDTGDILLQQQITFDPNIETLRSSYSKLHLMIQGLFRENWDSLKLLKISPKKQYGEGTTHKKDDMQCYAEILDYDDKICEFLKKVKTVNYTHERNKPN